MTVTAHYCVIVTLKPHEKHVHVLEKRGLRAIFRDYRIGVIKVVVSLNVKASFLCYMTECHLFTAPSSCLPASTLAKTRKSVANTTRSPRTMAARNQPKWDE